MPNTNTTWTEKQIATAARNVARMASRLRRIGQHDQADAMVKGAQERVMAIRAAGLVAR